MNRRESVFITGAGSGIGLATARVLASSGYRVFGGVHRVTPEAEDFEQVSIDVTSESSVAETAKQLEKKVGNDGLFALVNNAGVGDMMPLEFTPMQSFRAVFDVNVFGVLAVTQAILPMLHRGRGRIVNIGSIGGMITIPFGGALTASKHAIEAISDGLRMELHGAGIAVTCLQPASINSGSAEKLAARTESAIAALPPEGQRRYGQALRHFTEVMVREESSGSPPEVVAEAVLEVLRAGKPPSRKLVGSRSRILKLLARNVPDNVRDALLRKILFGGGNEPT